jgi:hypothetical protein
MTVRRESHEWKHPQPRLATPCGIRMQDRDEQPSKARYSIRESIDPVSNLTPESDLQSLNAESQIISTQFGIQIDESE